MRGSTQCVCCGKAQCIMGGCAGHREGGHNL